jgi:hypothetical protein
VDATALALTAKRIIDASGMTVTLINYTDATPSDPNMPWRIPSMTEVSQSVKAVFLASTAEEYRPDDGLTHTQEKRCLIAASGLSVGPSLKGEIRIGSNTVYKITSVELVAPTGIALYYVVGCSL